MDLTAANVAAQNKANGYANRLYTMLALSLADFIGHQIIKADGGLMAKVEKLLPEMNDKGFHVYRERSQSTLSWKVQTLGDTGLATLIMGRMEDGRLMEVSSPPQLCETLNVKEITEAHDRIRALRKEINDINGSIEPFFFQH